MASKGSLESAEKIVLAIFKKKPDTPGLPSSLIRLSQAFYKNGRMERGHRYQNLICEHYPDSVEATLILRSNSAG